MTFKNYGEGAEQCPVTAGPWPDGRDKDRVRGWIDDLKKAEQTGELPHFMIMSLGEDHTHGTLQVFHAGRERRQQRSWSWPDR